MGQYDNGNIYGVANNKDNSRSQVFGYDALNRLTSGYTPNLNSDGSHNWWEGFSYDNWGNLLAKNTAGGDTSLSVGVNSNNQVTAWCYDAAGNVVGASVCPSFTNIYDGENRLTQTTTGAGTTSYGYDAVGQRVKKSNGSIGTLYWQGTGGEVLEETDLNGNFQHDYVFFAGRRVARLGNPPPPPPPPCRPGLCPPPPPCPSCSPAPPCSGCSTNVATGATDLNSPTVQYYFSDYLGSANVVTDAMGNIQEESDFYPFGGERVVTDLGIGNNYKFTGKERDPETGCDYFGARYYCNSIGRFLTPDWAAKPVTVPYAKFGDPQSLNLYSYVENGPVNRVDADGHSAFPALDSMSNMFSLFSIPLQPNSDCQTLGQNCDRGWQDRNRRPYIGAGPSTTEIRQQLWEDRGVIHIMRGVKTTTVNDNGSTTTTDTSTYVEVTNQKMTRAVQYVITTKTDANGDKVTNRYGDEAVDAQENDGLSFTEAEQAVGQPLIDAMLPPHQPTMLENLWEHKGSAGGGLVLGATAIACGIGEPCGAIVLIGGTVIGTGGIIYDIATHH